MSTAAAETSSKPDNKGTSNSKDNNLGGGRKNQRNRRNNKKDEKDNEKKPTSDTNSKPEAWFATAMKALLGQRGVTDEKEMIDAVAKWKDAATSSTGQADQQFKQLTLWLEDCFIRQWSIEERNKLRKEFWKHIERFLNDLDCPYVGGEDGGGGEQDENNKKPRGRAKRFAWQTNLNQRGRVVHWLLACATFEQFGDVFVNDVGKKTNVEATEDSVNVEDDAVAGSQSAPHEEETAVTSKNADAAASRKVGVSSKAATKTLPAASLERDALASAYPLGFSTGDDQVDHVLTLLRMQLLMDLEKEQIVIAQTVAKLQESTTAQAKPLKQYKQRRGPKR